MSDETAPREGILHRFEFRGSGGEFFRIWIVNLALTLITLGIYSAWAKVRTRRYFYGNTLVAGHGFDYHASPWKILIGRLVAVGLFVGYNLSVSVSPLLSIPWIAVLIVGIPWLITSSWRFNARNTSYRNVRFNFTGLYWGAFKTFILWPLAGVLTFGGLMPLAHRARNYFYVNRHTFGGKAFATEFSGWSIYKIYLQALLLLLTFIVLALVVATVLIVIFFRIGNGQIPAPNVSSRAMVNILTGSLVFLGWFGILAYVRAKVFNLTFGRILLDGHHKFGATLSPWMMAWIGISNLALTLVTIGMFYPWARIRTARYMADHVNLLAKSDLNEFTSEAVATQSAIGEEIAGFFDFDIGL